MRKSPVIAAVTIAATLAAATPAAAWGFVGHRTIMARAIDLLPVELKPFFERFRDEIVIRVVDPDLWRNVGWEDDPNHFVDFGLPQLGPYPFAALPREYSQALDSREAVVAGDHGDRQCHRRGVGIRGTARAEDGGHTPDSKGHEIATGDRIWAGAFRTSLRSMEEPAGRRG